MNVWKPSIGTQGCPGQVKSHAGLVNLAAHLPDQASGKTRIEHHRQPSRFVLVSVESCTRSVPIENGGE